MLGRVIQSAGIDDAVFFSLLNKAAVICFTAVTLGLVLIHFSPENQGYYYTFTSLLVLQSFLEMGMGVVLAQFLSHEWSRIHFDASGHLAGEESALNKVSALVSVACRWYVGAAVAFLLLVGTGGSFLISRHGATGEVLAPWWILCTSVSISILQIPLRSMLEGSNQIARVQKIATLVSLFAATASWTAIIAGLGLYSLAISAGVSAGTGLILFGRACVPFLRVMARKFEASCFSWRDEFWPQQWRIAVSWSSGFFMFQSFVPILFYFQGAVPAGRMGASLQIYNAINAVASAWAYSKGPQMGILGSRGKVVELQETVRHVLLRSSLVCGSCAVLVIIVLVVMDRQGIWLDRFVGVNAMAVLLLALVVLQRSNIETLAIRFQKAEPFVAISILSALLVCLSNVVLSIYSSVLAVCIGYAIVMIFVTAPCVHLIYKSRIRSLIRA
jgi:hypothetical protein